MSLKAAMNRSPRDICFISMPISLAQMTAMGPALVGELGLDLLAQFADLLAEGGDLGGEGGNVLRGRPGWLVSLGGDEPGGGGRGDHAEDADPGDHQDHPDRAPGCCHGVVIAVADSRYR
jgi:hypothetical protein